MKTLTTRNNKKINVGDTHSCGSNEKVRAKKGGGGGPAELVQFQKEFIPSVEKRIERKEFTQSARRTHYQDADSGNSYFRGRIRDMPLGGLR